MSDLISRQAAIDEIRKCRFVVDAIDKIKDLQSAEPKHGKWVYHYRLKKFVCLECGYEQKHKPEWKYCPNCGARMDG